MPSKDAIIRFYKVYCGCGFDVEKAAKEYGIKVDSGRRYLDDYKKLYSDDANIDQINQIELDKKVRAAKAEKLELERSVKYWQNIAHENEEQLNTYLAITQGKKAEPIVAKKHKNVSETTAFLVCSDWHIEENITLESVNGLNESDLGIAKSKVDRLFISAVKLCKIWGTSTHIKNLILALLGDFMSGYIHDELVEDNDLSPVETILVVFQKICGGIDYILEHTDYTLVIPCTIGNHSRTTEKPRRQTAYKNNYEWLMYNFLADTYKNEPRVTFQIAQSYFTYLTVYDKVIRFHHGDWLRYNGGVGGISVPVVKAIDKWNISRKADIDVFGHWHQFKDFNTWVSNGSLIGYNAFAIYIKAAFERPSQTLFMLEKNKGKTATMPIYLD